MSEQRRFSRFLFDTESVLSLDGSSRSVQLIDISLKGARVEFSEGPVPAPGAKASLEVVLLGGNATIRMETEVVHCEERRVGLCCLRIDLESIGHLRRLLELNSGDPQLIERELSALL
jgi:hypothetical protein